ncbi:MAG: GTP-binding protein, partial [Clostridia bacterium]
MAGSFEKRPEKHICAALLAHVDAGKTTLSEALLYGTGAIRKLGRVDHGDAFLDTDSQERERGITIFSKQAEMKYDGTTFMLLDTPGHVDFSAEMERTLQVLDIAILVISGKDGVQGHTATLWKLMEKYRLPVFIFVNKMDLDGTDRAAIMAELRRSLGSGCMEFDVQRDAAWQEQVAMCDEEMIEEFLENGSLDDGSIAAGIAKRRIFPCCFGSALKMQGVDELLEIVSQFSLQNIYPAQFGARVFKISRDRHGMRLTHMKITGGALNVKDAVVTAHTDDDPDSGLDDSTEKIEQIRIYSGEKYRTADTVQAGDVCAVTGLKNTYA